MVKNKSPKVMKLFQPSKYHIVLSDESIGRFFNFVRNDVGIYLDEFGDKIKETGNRSVVENARVKYREQIEQYPRATILRVEFTGDNELLVVPYDDSERYYKDIIYGYRNTRFKEVFTCQ